MHEATRRHEHKRRLVNALPHKTRATDMARTEIAEVKSMIETIGEGKLPDLRMREKRTSQQWWLVARERQEKASRRGHKSARWPLVHKK